MSGMPYLILPPTSRTIASSSASSFASSASQLARKPTSSTEGNDLPTSPSASCFSPQSLPQCASSSPPLLVSSLLPQQSNNVLQDVLAVATKTQQALNELMMKMSVLEAS